MTRNYPRPPRANAPAPPAGGVGGVFLIPAAEAAPPGWQPSGWFKRERVPRTPEGDRIRAIGRAMADQWGAPPSACVHGTPVEDGELTRRCRACELDWKAGVFRPWRDAPPMPVTT